ncbi:MAG: class I SAM-dependent methyltransferase [Gammaproteobacteria bacterium]|nr:MAG: class I SAM-dependent methyltransferase [Gammaproteobacteria bacterium]
MAKNKSTISLRSYQGKRLVSFLRNGDYAHPGETEAIIQVMSKFPKNKHQVILDAGCGLGGTAFFIKENHWGNVIGIDIETNSILHAKKHYPSLEFHIADVNNAKQVFDDRTFDLICLFNSFYAFHDQTSALLSLADIAKSHSKIAIFDYSDPLISLRTPLYREGNKETTPFKPIKINQIKELLRKTHWHLTELIDITDNYIKWYSDLLNKLLANKNEVIEKFGQPLFNKAHQVYFKIHDSLLKKMLGGAIIYAEKQI